MNARSLDKRTQQLVAPALNLYTGGELSRQHRLTEMHGIL